MGRDRVTGIAPEAAPLAGLQVRRHHAGVEKHFVDELPLLAKDLSPVQMLEGYGVDTNGVQALIQVQPAESVERLFWLRILDDRTREEITLRRPVELEELGLRVMVATGHGHDRVFKPFYWDVKDAPPHPWPEVRVLKDAPEPKPAKKRRRSSR